MECRKVAVLMGSDSDLDSMKEAAVLLDKFEIPCELDVISAHRSPKKAHDFAVNAESNGYAVIIAGAGGAAHLAGVLASLTTLPVIGVPMTSKLDGLDSLLSTVQMPAGIPVATMGIGASGARNAALFAVSILALDDASLAGKLKEYRAELAASVDIKSEKVRSTR